MTSWVEVAELLRRRHDRGKDEAMRQMAEFCGQWLSDVFSD
jgi:hypothetical protein